MSGLRTNVKTGFKLVLDTELDSGNLTLKLFYKITATEADHFYVGCAVGDFFAAEAETALDGSNKVKQVIFMG